MKDLAVKKAAAEKEFNRLDEREQQLNTELQTVRTEKIKLQGKYQAYQEMETKDKAKTVEVPDAK